MTDIVLLGVHEKGPAIPNPKASKAGGRPWYFGDSIPNFNKFCVSCGKPLYFICQIYAPVDFDRWLYIFGCNSISCCNDPQNWVVIRTQSQPEQIQESTQELIESESKLVEKNGWDDQDDWGNFSSSVSVWDLGESEDNPCGEVDLDELLRLRDMSLHCFVDKKNSERSQKQNMEDKALIRQEFVGEEDNGQYLVEFLIGVEEEILQDPRVDRKIQMMLKQYEEEEKVNRAQETGKSREEWNEDYESEGTALKKWHKFAQIIENNPLQCWRYAYEKNPLLPIPNSQITQPPPCTCGNTRVFEFQLMPPILYFLKVDENSNEEPMNWKTVLIYVCPQSCSQSHQEAAIIIPEEESSILLLYRQTHLGNGVIDGSTNFD